MKIILCGAGQAAEGVLAWLVDDSRVEDIAIFTHPDTLVTASLAPAAIQAGMWYTLDNINNVPLPFEPDLIVSIYYRHLFKKPLLDRFTAINAHTSLLPRHRGRSPVAWALVEGDTYSGVTYHYIDEGIDTGPIILQAAVLIDKEETQASLFEKINQTVIAYFPPAFELVLAGVPGVPQRGAALHHPAGCPYDGQIDAGWPWSRIERFVRAMILPPLAPARLGEYEVRTMDDYRKALYERHNAKRNHSITV